MAEPKTTCRHCKRSMLQRTADDNNGFCVPCSRDPAIAMPDDFRLDEDLAERLRAIGKDPLSVDSRSLQWRNDRDFAEGYIQRQEERAAHRAEWHPRLLAFAADSRQDELPETDDEPDSSHVAIRGVAKAVFAQEPIT
ncbi:MAG: hypothetical protein AAF266_03080 [Planctomycetota bacterium]